MCNEHNSEVLYQLHPEKVRDLIRNGRLRKPTFGIATNYTHAGFVILPEQYAYDFLLYTQRNPKACPLLEVSEKGAREMVKSAKGSDIARDVTRYRIYEHGTLVGEACSIERYWRDDLVSFLLGSSYSFDSVLRYAGIHLRGGDSDDLPPMFITNIETEKAGIFRGPLVVSMRVVPRSELIRTVKITGLMRETHGAPVHFGDPSYIGIKDIMKPDFGKAVIVGPDEVPVFWASSVTAQLALMNARIDFVVTQAPGHRFVTDIKTVDLGSERT